VGTDPPAPGTLGPGFDRRTTEVTMSLKKVIGWLVIAFVIFYVIQAPEASANLVRSAGQALGNAAESVATFIGSLV
jgi:large-conductance mechanosensitive channel